MARTRQAMAGYWRAGWIGALLLLLVAAHGGCGGTQGDETPEGPAIASAVQAVRNAPGSWAADWSVGLDVDLDGSIDCTGSTLTGRWILTAAHCVASQPKLLTLGVTNVNDSGTPVSSYRGTATAYLHPGVQPRTLTKGAAPSAANDMALIHLHGAGISRFTNALLLSDSADPSSASAVFSIPGFGRESCSPHDIDGTKRTGTFDFAAGSTWLTTRGGWQSSFRDEVCDADAGAGWYVNVGGRELLWAVQSSMDARDSCGCNRPGAGITGSRIKPKIDWIIDTARAAGAPIICTSEVARSVVGGIGHLLGYLTCEDFLGRAPVLPNLRTKFKKTLPPR